MDYMAPFSFVYNNTRYCGFDASFKETDRSYESVASLVY